MCVCVCVCVKEHKDNIAQRQRGCVCTYMCVYACVCVRLRSCERSQSLHQEMICSVRDSPDPGYGTRLCIAAASGQYAARTGNHANEQVTRIKHAGRLDPAPAPQPTSMHTCESRSDTA